MPSELEWWQLVNFSSLYKRYLVKTFNPSRSFPGRREKINLKLYFHASLWCLKRFYEGFKGLHETWWVTTKECENESLSLIFVLIKLSEIHGVGRVNQIMTNSHSLSFIRLIILVQVVDLKIVHRFSRQFSW